MTLAQMQYLDEYKRMTEHNKKQSKMEQESDTLIENIDNFVKAEEEQPEEKDRT